MILIDGYQWRGIVPCSTSMFLDLCSKPSSNFVPFYVCHAFTFDNADVISYINLLQLFFQLWNDPSIGFYGLMNCCDAMRFEHPSSHFRWDIMQRSNIVLPVFCVRLLVFFCVTFFFWIYLDIRFVREHWERYSLIFPSDAMCSGSSKKSCMRDTAISVSCRGSLVVASLLLLQVSIAITANKLPVSLRLVMTRLWFNHQGQWQHWEKPCRRKSY